MSAKSETDFVEMVVPKLLLGQKAIGEPADIGPPAVWIAYDQADYVVGTVLFVDGGMTLYTGFEGHG